MRFEGVYVATVTPFLASGEIDWKSVDSLNESLLAQGVHGLVPCGTTGEGPTIRPQERIQLIERAVNAARKHSKKVIAGCGSNSTETALNLCREAKEIGADAALIVTPYYNRPTMAGVVAHFQHLAAHSPLPIVLYNVPCRTNVNLTVEAVRTLFEHPNIVGIKEASGQHSQWLGIAHHCNLKEKALLAGDDDAFASILSMGGSGIISATANVAPKAFVEIFDAAKAGQWGVAHCKQSSLVPLVRAMFVETNPSPVKYALKTAGKIQEDTVRLPLVSLSEAGQKQVKAALGGVA